MTSQLNKLIVFFRGAGRADLGEDRVFRTLLSLAVPSVAMVVFYSLLLLVDTVFISWLGEVHMIAVSYVFPFQLGAFALLEGISNGLAALIAHKLGERNFSEAQRIASSGLVLGYVLSLPLFIFMLPSFSNYCLFLFGCTEPAVLAKAWRYNMWLPASFIFTCFAFIANTIFRCQGNTAVPLKSFIVANVANVILDPVFIFVFGWGISGAAFSSFIGRVLAALYLAEKLKNESRIKTGLFSFVPHRWMLSYWKKIIRVGFPVMLTASSVALGIGSINRIITGTFGSQAVAAWMLGMRLEDVVLGTLVGINDALVPFLAYNYARKDKKRLRKGLRAAFIISAVITGLLGFVVGFFPLHWISVFNPTKEIGEIAAQAVRITLAGFPLVVYIVVYNALFIATGHAVYGTVATLSRTVILRVPVTHFLSAVVSVSYIWLFQPISCAGAALITAYYGNRLIHRIESDSEMNDVFESEDE